MPGEVLALELPELGGCMQLSTPMILDADVLHRVDSAAPRFIVFFDPETHGWRLRSWFRRMGLGHAPVPAPFADELVALASSDPHHGSTLDRLAELRDSLGSWRHWGPAPAPDSMILEVAARVIATTSIDRGSLAALTGLSPRRLSQAFRATTGLTLRRYAVWAKVSRALLAASRGAQLSSSSVEAGFSDQAHLSRSLAALLGQKPSQLPLGRSQVRGNFFSGLGPQASGFVEST